MISSILIPKAHCDSIVYDSNDDRGRLYLTDQYGDRVLVYRIISDNEKNKIEYEQEIGGYNFPHGIDVKDNLLAVTEYGSSQVILSLID